MVEMVLDLIVHKSKTSVGVGRGGKARNVSIIGVLEKNIEPTVEKDGIDTLSMVDLIVRRTCFSVIVPLGL